MLYNFDEELNVLGMGKNPVTGTCMIRFPITSPNPLSPNPVLPNPVSLNPILPNLG